jgi:AraC-like DNA-binding protein
VAAAGDPQLTRALIPPTVLAGVVEIGQREERPIAHWFSGTGLEPARLLHQDAVKISFRQAATILRRALRAMPGRPIGMQVGGRDVLLSFGMLGVAMRSCATVAEAMALGLDLHQAGGSLLDIEAETFDGESALRLRERWPDPELVGFLCEEALCSIVVFTRSMLGADWSPTCIELSYPAPAYAKEYRRFFGCPVRFGADANRMLFPTTALDCGFPTHHEPTRAIAVDACRRLLDLDGARPDVVVAVETLLNRNLRHPVTMAEAAHHLHVTERTLRRQLAAVGERFSTVRDRVRERRATFLLRESALRIGAVAAEIGFSDAREFRRAYIRWTGHPPSTTRRTG